MQGSATMGVPLVDPPWSGLHQVLDSCQVFVKAGSMERWQTLEKKMCAQQPFILFTLEPIMQNGKYIMPVLHQ